MEKNIDRDQQFDSFLKKGLSGKVPAEVEERMRIRLREFRNHVEKGNLKRESILVFPGFWKFATIPLLLLILISGIYFKNRFLSLKKEKAVSEISYQEVCVDKSNGERCNIIKNQLDCLALALKDCVDSKGYLMTMNEEIKFQTMSVEVNETILSESEKRDETCTEVNVIVKIINNIPLEEKNRIVKEVLDHCPICDKFKRLACVSYEIIE